MVLEPHLRRRRSALNPRPQTACQSPGHYPRNLPGAKPKKPGAHPFWGTGSQRKECPIWRRQGDGKKLVPVTSPHQAIWGGGLPQFRAESFMGSRGSGTTHPSQCAGPRGVSFRVHFSPRNFEAKRPTQPDPSRSPNLKKKFGFRGALRGASASLRSRSRAFRSRWRTSFRLALKRSASPAVSGGSTSA